MAFRKYLAGTVFVVLLIWGPINESWPVWLGIRIGYLILIPFLVWVLLGWIWNHWQLNEKTDNILERILSGIISLTLFVLAIFEAVSDTHIGNTQWIRTRDGMEAVGDDIILQGPDWGFVFILVFFAIIILWFLVLKKGSKTSD
ncbi:MAG: hypothetical protein JXB49_25025 [Bacteroidales bacterium]|nr:hypothetical protein [Bacteroidales bacterium]